MNRNHKSMTSEHQFEQEMKDIVNIFSKKEGEETWETMSNSFVRLNRWILEDDITEYTNFVKYIEELKEPIKNSLMSKRTILSGNAVKFMESISLKMKDRFDPINQLFIPTIMTIFGNNNKVQRDRMLRCYHDIIKHSRLPRMIARFAAFIVNKKTRNNFDRMCILECLDTLVKVNNAETIKAHQQELERLIKASIESPHMESRVLTRCLYQTYKSCLPQECEVFEGALPPQLQKSLNMPIPKKSSSMQLKKKVPTSTLSKTLSKKTTTTTTTTTTTSVKPTSREKPTTTAKPTVKKPLVKSRVLLRKPIRPTVLKKEVKNEVQKPTTITTTTTTTKKLQKPAAIIKEDARETHAKEDQENKPAPVIENTTNLIEDKKEKAPVQQVITLAQHIRTADTKSPPAMVPSFSTPSKNKDHATATPDSRPSQPQPRIPSVSTSLPTLLVTNNRLSREVTVPVHPPARVGIKRSRSSTGSTGSSTGRPSKIPLKTKDNIPSSPSKRVKTEKPASLLDIYKGIEPSPKPVHRFKKPAL